MGTKYLYKFLILINLTLVLSFLSSAASQEELGNHLKKYLELTESQKTTRVFRFADGYPRVGMYALTDQDSMLWFAIYNPAKYYVFTGTDFIDVLATNELAQEDSIAFDIQTDDKTPYLVGKKAIYKWLGYKLQAYKWPSHDRILEAYNAGKEQVYIFGERGYGVLSCNSWNYYRYKGFTLSRGDKFVDSMYSKEQGRLIWLDQVIGNEDSIRISIIQEGKRNYSTVPLGKHGLDRTNKWLMGNHVEDGHLIFALHNGKYVYSLKKADKHISQIDLPQGRTCSGVSKFKNKVVIITETDSKENWIVSLNQLDFVSLKLKEIQSMRLIFSEKELISWLGIYYMGVLQPLQVPEYISSIYEDKYLKVVNFDKSRIESISFSNNMLWSRYNRDNLPNSIDVAIQDKEYADICSYERVIFDDKGNYSIERIATLKDIERYQIYGSHIDGYTLYYTDHQGLNALPLSRNTEKVAEAKSRGKYNSAFMSSNSPSSFIRDYTLVNLSDRLILVQRQLEGETFFLNFYEYKDGNFSLIDKVSDKTIQSKYLWGHFPSISDYEIDYEHAAIIFRNNKNWWIFNALTKGISNTKTSGSYYNGGVNFVVNNSEKKVVPYSRLMSAETFDYNRWHLFKKYTAYPIEDYMKTGFAGMMINTSVIDETNGSLYVNGRKKYSYSNGMYQLDDYSLEVIDTVSISPPGPVITLRYPTYRYNLSNGEVILHPHWLRVLRNQDGRLYVIYKNKTGANGTITIRRLVNGVALSKKDDPVISWKDLQNAVIEEQKRMNNDLFLRIGNSIHYLENGIWHKRYIPELESYTNVYNGITIGQNIYLGLDSKIMKIMEDGSCFTYGENYGIPKGSIRLVSYKGKIFINTGSAIYEFHEPKQNARIALLGFSAKDKLVSATQQHSFDYKTNSFRFPVYILNTLYPERCILEYQLKGFNDTPVRIPFTKEIRFDNLKPGSYSFSYTATTETGQKVSSPVVKFVILPPFYATWWAYLIYALVGSAVIYGIFKLRTRQLKRQNLALEKTVEQRTAELKERQQRIQESIEYASLIQKSILPQREELIQRFRQHFVIWKPRDIVGGDFYWLYVNEAGETFFAVIDCTGHGVPGALLSMTVNSLLDKLVKDGGICSPAEILTRMHREIGAALHQTEAQTQQDGIEIALIKINPSSQTLTFSGGGLHLLHYDPESKDTSHLRGNKHGLGGLKWHAELVFDEQVIPYAEKQRIYLYTDGILDQPVAEAEKPKRLGSVAWLEFLSSIASLPMEEQETNCNELIGRMLACHEQRDDITVVGIEL